MIFTITSFRLRCLLVKHLFTILILLKKNREEVWAECHRLKEELMVTREQALEAERLTVHQRKSHFWLDIRIVYCTGSLIYQICRTDPAKPSISFIKKICFPGKPLSTQ
jgi:hypothetical protein